MSNLTRCNFCVLQDLRRLAATRNHILTLRPASFPSAGIDHGVDVYLHPPDYTPPLGRCIVLDEGVNNGPGEWWAAWFAAVPSECACNT